MIDWEAKLREVLREQANAQVCFLARVKAEGWGYVTPHFIDAVNTGAYTLRVISCKTSCDGV